MGYQEEMEHAGEVARQGANPVYPTQEKGVTIPANTTLESYIDVVSGTATFAKDSDLTDGSINAVFNTVHADINGTGNNFKVGDDAFIGDVNKTNTIAVSGLVDGGKGFIQFGSGSTNPSIGYNKNAGLPAIGTSQAVTGSLLVDAGKLYFYNGTSGNAGWAQVI